MCRQCQQDEYTPGQIATLTRNSEEATGEQAVTLARYYVTDHSEEGDIGLAVLCHTCAGARKQTDPECQHAESMDHEGTRCWDCDAPDAQTLMQNHYDGWEG